MTDRKKHSVRSVPALGRKWLKSENRWCVVLKVEKWDKGVMLMTEAPLAMSCGYERPMAPTPDSTTSTGSAATAASAPVQQEAARMKRWLAAQKLKWSTEQILLHEILVYCKNHQPRPKPTPEAKTAAAGAPKSYGPAPPPTTRYDPVTLTDDLSSLIPSAQWLMDKHAHDIRSNAAVSATDAMLHVLRTTALPNHTLFSRAYKGTGWYPLLGHVRQIQLGTEGKVPTAAPKQINAMLTFQNSNASLIAMADLKRGDEIVIAAPPPAGPVSASDDFKALVGQLQNGSGAAWQQLAASVAQAGMPALTPLERHSLTVKQVQSQGLAYLQRQWLTVEHEKKYGPVPDLMRVEFMLIYLEQQQPRAPPPPPPVPQKPATAAAMPALVDFANDDAPAIRAFKDQMTPDERKLYQQLSIVANRRLMIYDLLPAMQNDPLAHAYNQLWHQPKLAVPGCVGPPVSLFERWNGIVQKLSARHPSLLDQDP